MRHALQNAEEVKQRIYVEIIVATSARIIWKLHVGTIKRESHPNCQGFHRCWVQKKI